MIAFITLSCGGGGGRNKNPSLEVYAGDNQTVNELTVVELSGSVEAVDITIDSIVWTQITGPQAVLDNGDALLASFTALDVSGDAVLTFQLEVTADDNTVATDTIQVTVRDRTVGQLGVNAGTDQTVDERTAFTLNGTVGITDIASVAWTQTGGPSVVLADTDTLTASFISPNVTADVVLTFELEVTASDNTVERDTVLITVQNINQVFFSAHLDIEGKEELYQVDIDGGGQQKLNHALDPETAIFLWEPSPNGRYVAYIPQNQVNFDEQELYVASTRTGASVRVSGDLPVGGNVDNFAWSPDSTRIVYHADQNRVGEKELFIVTPDGATRFRISSDLAGDSVMDFQWAPNSLLVAYTVDRNGRITELYVTDATQGSQSVLVSGPMTPGGGRSIGSNGLLTVGTLHIPQTRASTIPSSCSLLHRTEPGTRIFLEAVVIHTMCSDSPGRQTAAELPLPPSATILAAESCSAPTRPAAVPCSSCPALSTLTRTRA